MIRETIIIPLILFVVGAAPMAGVLAWVMSEVLR
jgi:hypothetical protein